MPGILVSLTAPKPLVKWFTGRHFIGGRYVTSDKGASGSCIHGHGEANSRQICKSGHKGEV